MSRKISTPVLQVLHEHCCGLDIHKDKIAAAIIKTEEDGTVSEEIAEFGTFTDELYRLKQWLLDNGCYIVAMESTGVYWRPVHNILEDVCKVVLVNARHTKHVPGRKTDISDSRWLAGLLRHGLVKASYIPEQYVREWRDLTRLRRMYVESLSDYKRRVHKLLECANIKIDSVASELFGVTGRNLMNLLISGGAITQAGVSSCTKGRLRSKTEELTKSINGFFEEHHRFQLISLLRIVDTLEQEIEHIHGRIREMFSSYEDTVNLLVEVPGISLVSAHAIISEIGDRVDNFQSAGALASWAGLCPGNNESAGKRHSGRSPVRKGKLKTIMAEVAWGAIRKKGTYYQSKFYSLRARKGAKKAIIAVAHHILKAVYAILKDKKPYRELGEDYLTERNKTARLQYLHKQAEKLGYKLIPLEQAA